MDQSSSGAAGRTQQALKFRMVTHVTSAQSVEVGDVEGHVASLARFSGLAFFPDEVAIVSFVSTTDYINGEGEFVLYPVIIFDDGATLCIRSCGRGKVEGAKTKFVGTLTVVDGKGAVCLQHRVELAPRDRVSTAERFNAVGCRLVKAR